MANSEAREKAKEYLHDVVSIVKEQKDNIKKCALFNGGTIGNPIIIE